MFVLNGASYYQTTSGPRVDKKEKHPDTFSYYYNYIEIWTVNYHVPMNQFNPGYMYVVTLSLITTEKNYVYK